MDSWSGFETPPELGHNFTNACGIGLISVQFWHIRVSLQGKTGI